MMKKKLISILLFIPTFQMILISRGNEDFSKYLKETPHLDYNSPIFTEALSKVVREDMTLTEKLEKLYYFTRDFIPFADSASLTASGALKKNKAICYTKAMIFVSFCRRLGVPAKLALINFTVNENQKKQSHSHGIAKIFIAGKWIYLDTVSNSESWRLWKCEKAQTFNPPKFSVNQNVLVSQKLYDDMVFEDYASNDIPEEWLKDMKKFLETGKW